MLILMDTHCQVTHWTDNNWNYTALAKILPSYDEYQIELAGIFINYLGVKDGFSLFLLAISRFDSNLRTPSHHSLVHSEVLKMVTEGILSHPGGISAKYSCTHFVWAKCITTIIYNVFGKYL